MPYDVKLPDIGEGIAEGEIVRWLVKPGDAVREDQPLVEVMTDKASVEIPSPRTGSIAALHAEEGQVVPVGSVIISIALPGDATDTAAPAPSSSAKSAGDTATGPHGTASAAAVSPAGKAAVPIGAASAAGGAGATTASGSGRVQATPAVRQLAKQLGVVLEGLTGSGPGGAIVAADVQRAASAGAGSAPTGAVATAPAKPLPASGSGSASGTGEERVPLRGLRRRIAEHMRRSIDTAAHFTFVAECDMTTLVEHRAALRARAERAGIKLTYLAYVVKALIEPLRAYPMLNASLDDERQEIVLKHALHVGIATHTPEGLTVPVVHDCERISLFPLAREIQRLADAAREGHLRLEEIQNATFTVTSTGAKGGVLATPILHHPQVAILGVHEIKKRPAVVDGQIVARDLCNLSLSLDHRVVDGAVGADFLYAVIQRLEHPAEWLREGDIE